MKQHKLQIISDALLNDDKLKSFHYAISRVVKPGAVVLDVSSTVGLMSFLAIREGARKAILLETDEKIRDLTINNINLSCFDKLIEVVDTITDKIDVVIFGIPDTMLISGNHVRLANSLIKKGVITNKTRVIPRKITNYFELANCDYSFFDCHLPMILQLENTSKRCTPLGTSIKYGEVSLTQKTSLQCKYENRHLVYTHGWLNCMKFTSIMQLTEDLLLSTKTMVCVPTKVRSVRSSDVFDISLSYQIGGDYDTLQINY